jgi:hypothetical protein
MLTKKELTGIAMQNNDGVLYRGTEVVHWRDKMPDEYQVSQHTSACVSIRLVSIRMRQHASLAG